MGIMRRLWRSTGIGLVIDTVDNCVKEGSVVDGIAQTLCEAITEDSLIGIVGNTVIDCIDEGVGDGLKKSYIDDMKTANPFTRAIYEEGTYDGRKEGYDEASEAYENKLLEQADLFLRQTQIFEEQMAQYEQLLDEYEKRIDELEAKNNRTEAENRILQVLLSTERKLKNMQCVNARHNHLGFYRYDIA